MTRFHLPHASAALVFVLIVCVCASDGFAETITIDFNSAAPSELAEHDYFEDGFRISVVENHYDFWPGDNMMTIDTHGCGCGTVRLDWFGRTFDFRSVMIAYWAPIPFESLPLDETAFITSSNGGYAEITSAGVMRFSGLLWKDVSWIDFTVSDPNLDLSEDSVYDPLKFDDIRVKVPEPSSLFLLSLGLLALSSRCRRTHVPRR